MSQILSGFGLYSKRVLVEDGLREAVVIIKEGKIADIISPELAHPDCPVEDLGNLVIMPGLIDSHVHVNEPGRTEWEGFQTATRAAAAGGITTIADMPLNCDPVTTSLKALETKLPETAEKLWVDCAFYGGVVPGNEHELEPMIKAGVTGFKCFLVHSGIDEFPNVSEDDLRKAMPILAKHKIPLLVHAEIDCGECIDNGRQEQAAPGIEPWQDSRSYKSFLASRPRQWENDAINLMIKLCREFKGPVHIVHLSSADALQDVSKARKDGLPFTVETCPHYLTFEAESIPDGDPRYKCAPPIREAENRERLWKGLSAGLIDFVVSDHSPCVPDLKHLESGDLKLAWGGISSLQFGLSTIWTEAAKRGHTIAELSTWMSARPAEFLGLTKVKGKLSRGLDADLIVFDPEAEFTVLAEHIHHKHKVTPYEGRSLKGKVLKTYLRGQLIFEDGKLTAVAKGTQLLRQKAEIRA